MRKISAVFLAALLCILCFAGVSTAEELIQDGDFSEYSSSSGFTYWGRETSSTYDDDNNYAFVSGISGNGAFFTVSALSEFSTVATSTAAVYQTVNLDNVETLTFKTKAYDYQSIYPSSTIVLEVIKAGTVIGTYTFNNLGNANTWTSHSIDLSQLRSYSGSAQLKFSTSVSCSYTNNPYMVKFYLTDVSATQSVPVYSSSSLESNIIQVNTYANFSYVYTGTSYNAQVLIDWGDGATSTGTELIGVGYKHRYSAAGTYTITTTGSNKVGTGSTTNAQTIDVVDLGFDVSGSSSGNAPFDAYFTLTASNIASLLWNFGDGSTSTSTTNPTSHTYTDAGLYTVSLKGTTAAGRSLTVTKTDLINTQSQSVSFNASTYEVGSVATISWTLRDPVFSSHSYNLYVYPATADGSISTQNPVLTFEILNSTTTSTTWFTKGLTGGYYSAYIFEDSTSLAHTSPAVSLLSYVTLTVNLAISGATYYNSTTVDLIQNGATVYTNTTTEGLVKFENIASGTYQVQATTIGYATQSATVLLTESSSITIDFVTGTTDDTSSGMGSQYAASYVTFRCYDSGTGKPLSGVTVNVVGVEPTNPIEWMANLFGNAWGSKMIGTNLTGTSDDNGVVTFAMVPNVRYQVTIIYGTYKDEKVFQPSTLTGEYPLELEITKWDTINKFDSVVTSVTPTDDKQIIANYTDNTGTTQALNISLYGVTDGERVYISSQTATANSYIATFTPTSPSGRSYVVTINSTTTTLGKITREYSVDFNGPRIVIGNLPDNFYIILSFLILAMVGGVGSIVTSRMYCLVVVVVAAFLWYAGWLFALGTVGSIVLLLCFVLALIYYIASKSGGGD